MKLLYSANPVTSENVYKLLNDASDLIEPTLVMIVATGVEFQHGNIPPTEFVETLHTQFLTIQSVTDHLYDDIVVLAADEDTTALNIVADADRLRLSKRAGESWSDVAE